MRKTTLTLAGQKHLMVLSGRVAQEIEADRGVPMSQYLSEVLAQEQPKVSEYLYLTGLMLRAGDAYAKRNGIPNPPCPTPDELPDMIDMMDDVPRIAQAVIEIVNAERHVLAKDAKSKNAESAPA